MSREIAELLFGVRQHNAIGLFLCAYVKRGSNEAQRVD